MCHRTTSRPGCPNRTTNPAAHPLSTTTYVCITGLLGTCNISTSYEYSDEGALCAFCESLYQNSAAKTKVVLEKNVLLVQIRDLRQRVREMEREGRGGGVRVVGGWVVGVFLGCISGYLVVSECWFWTFWELAVLAAGVCCGVMAVALGRGGIWCGSERGMEGNAWAAVVGRWRARLDGR